MCSAKVKPVWLCALLLLGATRAAYAQFSVIDVAALTRLVQQVSTLTQQLQAARTQIAQAQTLYQSMTGSRGMQQLLNGAAADQLPTSWAQLTAVMQGGPSPFGALVQELSTLLANNAVLSPAQLSALPAAQQISINAERQSIAMLQAIAQQALTDSGNRFDEIQLLVNAIPGATDQKGVLELQATIAADLGLVQNEQSKLQVLYQAAQSEAQVAQQRLRELVIAGQGSFATRFEPTPQ